MCGSAGSVWTSRRSCHGPLLYFCCLSHIKMQAIQHSAFAGANTRVSVRSRQTTVVVRAVQDVQGKVVSTSMQNTVVVNVERLAPHPKYFKRIRQSKRYLAHVEDSSACQIGDYVRLEGCRPLSKNKRFKVAEVLRAADTY